MSTKDKRRDVKMSLIELQLALQYGLSLDEAKMAKQLNIPPEKIAHAKSTSLYKTIQKKLAERKVVANWSYLMLMALKAKKYAGNPDDKITNPLAISEQGCKPLYKNIEEKRAAFEWAVDYEDAVAWIDGKPVPLGGPGAELNDVEYVAGLWRVQNKEQYDTISVQEREFVLLDRLTRTEHTNFEYYSAAHVGWTGCGRSCDNKPGYIIGKYETGRGTFYAYGCQWADGSKEALATARAHLAGQVVLAYQDLIIADTIRADKAAEQSEKTEQKNLFQDKYEIISVQTQDSPENTQQIKESDGQFVLLNKLDRTENTNFEYYLAARVNPSSRYSSLDPDYIVAKYKTGRGTFYAYGCQLIKGTPEALATARAHLAVRVYDAYQDMIEAESRRVLDNQK
ncbi:MAG: hypothetical protein J6Y07_00775 [Alphaproteobacteria bacterium]|nr:hypothetical protein [Alphaproteobacteria bacterium]